MIRGRPTPSSAMSRTGRHGRRASSRLRRNRAWAPVRPCGPRVRAGAERAQSPACNCSACPPPAAQPNCPPVRLFNSQQDALPVYTKRDTATPPFRPRAPRHAPATWPLQRVHQSIRRRSRLISHGRSARDRPRPRGGAPRPRGRVRVRRAAARLLRVRGLPRGQRQQQLPHDHGAGRRAALRDRLPHAPAHGEVLQRAQHPRHHQRAPRRPARAAVPQPRPPRRPAARRRQLRVRRRRHPQRHRHTVREHHQDRAAAAELPGLPAEAGRLRRRGRGEAGRERCARPHHARRQRLRQQLLPGALLLPVSPVCHPRLRPVPHLRVQENPHAAVRARGPSRGGDGHRDDRVRAGGAGHAQHRRRVRARPHGGGRPLQPAAGADALRPQRGHRRRRLHRRQHQPAQLRLRVQSAGLRVRDVQGGVLRAGPVQRDRVVHAGVQRVPQPGRVRVLGRVPPHGARQPDHRRPVHARLHRPHQPHEHQHHPRHGQQGLGMRAASIHLGTDSYYDTHSCCTRNTTTNIRSCHWLVHAKRFAVCSWSWWIRSFRCSFCGLLDDVN